MLVATLSSEDNIALHFCTLKIAICMVQIMLSTDDDTIPGVSKRSEQSENDSKLKSM